MNDFIPLQELLYILNDSNKGRIVVNIYNEKEEILISFILMGWECLNDFICDDKVISISFKSTTEIDIKVDTTDDPEVIGPEGYYHNIIVNGRKLEDILVDFKGATETSKGMTGLVPEPQAGDQDKYLRGDGTWSTVSGGGGGGGTPIKETIGSASNWNAGAFPQFSIDNNTNSLTITNGTIPSLTITQKSVVTDIT